MNIFAFVNQYKLPLSFAAGFLLAGSGMYGYLTYVNPPNQIDLVELAPLEDEYPEKSPEDTKNEIAWEKKRALEESLVGYAIQATFSPAPVRVAHPQSQDYGTLYRVGTITNGSLQGETLYLEEVSEIGTYYIPSIVRDAVVVNLATDKFSFPYRENYPKEIVIPGTPHRLVKGYSGSYLFGASGTTTPLFTSAGLNFNRVDASSCIITELPDHTGVSYNLDIPFVNEEKGSLSITLMDGSTFAEEYSFIEFTCGGDCRLLKYADPATLDPARRLVQVGTDPQTKDPIYGIASPEDLVLKELYADENTLAYYRSDDNWEHAPVSKYTYAEFIQHRPLLYWKDPWGKWVEFRNKRFDVAAEKCKPVIYLYPEEAGEYHVEVEPNGGFTKTIPEYKGGWDVFALPDGTLTDLATGLTYPYLYWSGIGLNYPLIQDGWVVAKDDVDHFLDEKLYALGLEGKEIAEFKEYWVPRLSERPYYKITFLPKRVFDQLAPLTVAPQKPDTTIRVMMTAQGTDTREELPPLPLPHRPQRNGFVLVEWGGTLLY